MLHNISIIGGCGHIGLPLGILLAKVGHKVNLVDLDQSRVDLVNNAKLPFLEPGGEILLAEQINNKRLHATSDLQTISSSSIIITTVGTPVDEYQSPVPRIFRDFLNSIKEYLRADQLFILRSTVFPGTARWMANELEPFGVDLAFCPERILQGKAFLEIGDIPQIVSGASSNAVNRASILFQDVSQGVIECSLEEAELAKLYLNAFRYAQFAVSNEFYRIAVENGLDYSRIHNVMISGYERGKLIPKAGLAAGPCLLKDTQQLIAFSNNSFLSGNAAVLANEGLPITLIRVMEDMVELKNSTVGILGMAFKPEIDDIRSSLSYRVKKMLQLKAKDVLTTDPYVTADSNLLPLEVVIDRSDIIIICTPHNIYRDLDLKGKPVLDIWKILPKTESNRK
jgi:UDP-N-acetyl-D-mannosaminuronic acid dehydrogenase